MGPNGTFITAFAVLAAIVAPLLALRFGSGSRQAPETPAQGHRAARRRRAARTRAGRNRGAGVPVWATRLGLLMGAQLSGVLVVAVVANDYGQFYSSWSDLFGSGAAAQAADVTAHYGALPARPAPTHSVAAHAVAATPVAPRVAGGAPDIPAAAAGWRVTSW